MYYVRNSGNRSFIIGSHGFSWDRRKIITWADICQAIQIEQNNVVTHFYINQHGKYSINPIFFIMTNMLSKKISILKFELFIMDD